MKKNLLRAFVITVVVGLSLVSTDNYVGATTWGVDLPSSGVSGGIGKTTTKNSSRNSNCGGTYTIDHFVSYGAYNTSSFKFNYTNYKIRNLNGSARGGAAVIGNLEHSSENKWDYRHSGVELVPGNYYTYPWNHTIQLGSINMAADYEVSTISGLDTSTYACGNEDSIVFQIGARSSSSSANVLSDFSVNDKVLSESLGEEFSKGSSINKKHSVAYQYINHNDIVILTQQDTPIIVNNVPIDNFEVHQEKDFKYELSKFTNSAGDELIIIKLEKKNIYMALVSTLPEDKVIKLAKDIYSKN